MVKYAVSATLRGKRITTSKFWTKKSNAQKYADQTNEWYRNAKARVVKLRRG